MTEIKGRAGRREKDKSGQRLERIQLEEEGHMIRREKRDELKRLPDSCVRPRGRHSRKRRGQMKWGKKSLEMGAGPGRTGNCGWREF